MQFDKNRQALYRKIPGVDTLLMDEKIETALNSYPRRLVLKAVHQVLDDFRNRIDKGSIEESELEIRNIVNRALEALNYLSLPSLRPLINATGVVVHTNLGRSILADRALDRFRPIAGGYSNLEFDLLLGKRGSRYTHVEKILKELTSAEAAMVVNNNAAAVLVCLDTIAQGREVVVSRGQLVEIGGSFRIPEVMQKSGARMVEVGTTNKTHLKDYEKVIGPETALLLRVHKSNFQIVGFTEEVSLPELVTLGKKYSIPVMEDLGSGSFIDFSKYGITKEPTVQEALAQGVDLVTFSGDKLLGGPQAGIILGRKELVDEIKQNQLSRALRIDKLTLLSLEETLRLYRDEEAAIKEIPTLRMICQSYYSLKEKADRLLELIGQVKPKGFSIQMGDGFSRIGGGALPTVELRTRILRLNSGTLPAHYIESSLRAYNPPIIARLEKERVLLDIRTIEEGELHTVAQAVRELSLLEGL